MKKNKGHSGRYPSETFVGDMIVERWLYTHGWGYHPKRPSLHQHGVDIRMRNDKPPHTHYFFVEVKGASSARRHSSVDDGSIIGALGQIVTRMKTLRPTPNRYGIGFPKPLAEKAMHKIPWQAAQYLGLYIFSVDRKGNVIRYTWKDIKKLR